MKKRKREETFTKNGDKNKTFLKKHKMCKNQKVKSVKVQKETSSNEQE